MARPDVDCVMCTYHRHTYTVSPSNRTTKYSEFSVNQTTHETTPRKRNDSTMDCHHVHRATRSRTLSLFLSRTLSFTAVPSHEHTTLSLQTLRPGQDQASSHTMHTHYIRSSALELTVAPTTAPTVEPTTDLTAESTLDCCGSGPR